MRIIGGTLRGRHLTAPAGRDTRPTSDRIRGSVFDILTHRFFSGGSWEGLRVADVFAGTGAMGFEALSRGASHATFLDNRSEALRTIRANAEALNLRDRVSVVGGDALTPPRMREPFSLIFLDPPYALGVASAALAALAGAGWLGPDTLCAVELEAKSTLAPPEGWIVADERSHGRTKVVFVEKLEIRGALPELGAARMNSE
ncbi:MAG: 16S rRNA (guanine(966)-N(2))-methyltransferase RsmD [Alphaproteobacteria bacterium]|nr:16S rRNA (guanine(966)-N(2))-methyltransferase RsmD [Alphaproteobacteria bacterium]